MDGSLFDALSGKTIKDANFNNWINGLENSEKAAMSAGTALDKYKNSLQQTSSVGAKAGTVFKSLGATFLSMAALTAISFAIGKVGEGIAYAVNYSENLSETAKSAGQAITQTSTDLDSYKDKITELQGVLNDHSSTVEEVADAKSQLLDIQSQLSEKYGSEASGIDLVNGSLEKQLSILDEIGKSEFYKTQADVNDKSWKDVFADGLSAVGSFITHGQIKNNWNVDKSDQIMRDYQSYHGKFTQTLNNKELNDYMKSLGFNTAEITGTDASTLVSFNDNVEDVVANLEKVDAKVQELAKSGKITEDEMNKFRSSLSDVSDEANTFESEHKDFVDSKTFYDKIYQNDDLLNLYKNLTQAQQDYQDAVVSGDESAINKSLQSYQDYYDQIDSMATDEAANRYLSNLYDSTNSAMKQNMFDKAMETNSAEVADSVNKIKEAYSGLSEAQLQSTEEVQALAEQYGVSADYVVNKLKEVGAIQSDQYKELYAQFGDRLKTLTNDQLEIGYTIKNYGDMDFDQFKAKIEESQRIASNEIDIKSRTNLDNYNTAKEGGSQSDDYDSYVAMMKAGKELAAEGKKGTEEFKAAAIAFSENGMDDIDDWNENLAYLGKYFTEDASGAQAFIDTLKGMTYADGKTPFAKLNEDGKTYTLNLQDMQYMAEQLHMPLEMLSVLLQNLQSYGFSDSYFGTMEDGLDKLSSKSLELAEAKAKLSTMDPNQGTEYEAQKQKVKDLTDEITTLKDGIKQLREEEEKQPADTGVLEGAQSLADQYNAAKSDEEKTAIKQSMDKYANEYNVRFNFTTKGEAEVSRSIEDINSDIDQARATLEKLSQDNGGKLNMDDSEVQDAVKQMQDLIAEKQTAEAPAIMQIDASGLDGEVQDAVQKLQNVQNIVNQIEQAKVVPGADTSQLESELSSAIADVKNLSPDITAKLNLNTAEIQSEADTVQAKITAHASISENDLNTIKTTVAAVDPQLAIDASDEKANAKLNDIIAKINSSTGQIQVGADLSSANRAVAAWQPPNKTATLTYNIVTTGGVSAGATVKVPKRKKANGTFHGYAKGTNVSIPKDETALVNEVGTEALLRDGILYEIPGGAHTVP